MDEVAKGLALERRGHEGFGAGTDARDVSRADVRHARDLTGGADDVAVDRVADDDAGVVLDANGGGELGDEAAQIGDAADVLEAVLARELVRDSDLVDGLAAVPEGAAGRVDPGVLLAEEVFAVELWGDFVHRLRVDEKRGDDGLFRLDIMRRQLLCTSSLDDHAPGVLPLDSRTGPATESDRRACAGG